MELQLNLPHEEEKYKTFYGRNIDQMLVLLASNRVPISTKDVMERRIEVRSPDFGRQYRHTAHKKVVPAVRNGIWANSLGTGDGVLYAPTMSQKTKVITSAPFIRALSLEAELINGALNIEWYVKRFVLDEATRAEINPQDLTIATLEWYKNIDAPEFTLDQVLRDRFGTIWLALAGGDKALLSEYRKAVAEELEDRYGSEHGNMHVYFAYAQKLITGRLWCVKWCVNSHIYGCYNLDDVNSILIGEAQGLERKV